MSNSLKPSLREIAATTIAAIDAGSYTHHGTTYDLLPYLDLSKQNTIYYPPESTLANWGTKIPPSPPPVRPGMTGAEAYVPVVETYFFELSTLKSARRLSQMTHDIPSPTVSPSPTSPTAPAKIGILNFASAKNPGGGFLRGARAQEESIARSSTLYPTLLLPESSEKYYKTHKHDPKGGYYSHAMIFSPGVVLFRDDDGAWVEPLVVDVVTSPAVNAGVVYRELRDAGKPQSEGVAPIESAMRERMSRILFLFETQGIRNIVLGSFGTGAFRNDVGMVASIWADLVGAQGGRFRGSFDRVVFGILDNKTFVVFEQAFERRVEELGRGAGQTGATASANG